MKTRILYVLLIILLFGINSALAGTTYTWNTSSSGNWTTASNWSPNTGYPGKTGTTDVAIINTSSITITLSSSVTIATLKSTSWNITGVTISVSSGSTLTINTSVANGGTGGSANAFIFAGAGTTMVSGTITTTNLECYSISSGHTFYLTGTGVLDLATGNPHGNLTNAGTLNILSGAALKFGDQAALTNTGTIHSYKATYTFSGSGGCFLTNSGTIRDHGSSYTLTGQSVAFTNSGANVVTIQYSDLSNGIGNNILSIYPNPVQDNISLSIAAQLTASNSYNIKFMNSSGVIVKQVTSEQTSWQGSVSDLQPGTYIVQVLNSKNDTLVGQTKFVKL